MNCEQASKWLSAYFDGELDGDVNGPHREVRNHFENCEYCAQELNSFAQLRQLASKRVEPQLTPPCWESIAQRLENAGKHDPVSQVALAAGVGVADQEPAENAVPFNRTRRLAIGGLLTLAASVLLFFSLRNSPQLNNEVVVQANVSAINLQPLMELFKSDSEKALQMITNQLSTADVSLAKAEAALGRPTFLQASAKSNSLPGDAQLISTKLMQFPLCKCPEGACTCGPGGCNCVACICERPDGSTYLVLEHCKSQAVTFGNLPVQLVARGDRQLQQVEAEGTLAISWEQNGERLIAIGIRGTQEIEALLAKN